MPCLQAPKVTLLTVAVGDEFPTRLVLDYLRPAYHNTSDAVQLVFPLKVFPPPLPLAFLLI